LRSIDKKLKLTNRSPLITSLILFFENSGIKILSLVKPAIEIMEGLTKREVLAALAMQGLLANSFRNEKSIAEEAVTYADNLIAELEKSKSSDQNVRETLRRIYDIYGYAWPDPDRRTVRQALGMDDR